tara:strand:- start:445 stop:648 length:204 start_codon:yes stop_codon:yes gene_type:complete
MQNFGYSDDGYYRIEKWGGSAMGFSYALSTPDKNYMKVGGPFHSQEKRDYEMRKSIEENDKTAYNGA